jgi:hypothetical protein
MKPNLVVLVSAAGLISFLTAGCGRDSQAATHQSVETAGSPLRGACSHAACGNDFFVDVGSVAGCAVGTTCTLELTLVATGDYHINDQYPYKFTAADSPGVEFLGTDGGRSNVFSRPARNWAQ